MISPRIAARMFNTPLLAHPGKAAAIVAGLGKRVTGIPAYVAGDHEPLPYDSSAALGLGTRMGTLSRRIDKQAGAAPLYDVINGVAVIPVEGTLVHKGGWVESESGETSMQGLQAQVLRAARDPAVRGVVFEIDSYGGEVSGAFETAEMIARLSAAKPTIAILTDHAYSCGYLMASAARQIVLPDTGGCGSIGIIRMHVDMSRALEAAGLRVTLFKAGAHKGDFSPYDPVPEDVAAKEIARLEEMRVTFCETVARYRAGRLSYDDAMATEAQSYMGQAAVDAGLADATGNPFDAFEAFINAVNRA